MNYEDTVKRAEKLRKDLNYYSYRYYVDNENDIDDYEYDMMMRELKAIEKELFAPIVTMLQILEAFKENSK